MQRAAIVHRNLLSQVAAAAVYTHPRTLAVPTFNPCDRVFLRPALPESFRNYLHFRVAFFTCIPGGRLTIFLRRDRSDESMIADGEKQLGRGGHKE
ncbi:hypothetical protein Zmor_012622 [Zophobas morio]|uniref:Uncharacterized protein n=1 Tax=Zophobas morio TaxID=2755281 RepID=A0AA38I999_9CUCU|nr:hypothetical protein Zmor_012622 [Zophobas morio]